MERNINKDLDEIKTPSNRLLIYALIVAVTTLWGVAMYQNKQSDNRRNKYEVECSVMKERYEKKIDSLLVVLSTVKDKNLDMLMKEKDRYDSSIESTKQKIVILKKRKR